MTKKHLFPTLVAVLIGIVGILIILFAWHLPPFKPAEPVTENAYIRGRVTTLAPQLSGYIAEVDVNDFDTVKKGQIIARIDDRQYRQRLAQAEAAQAEAEAALKIGEQNILSAEAGVKSAEAALSAANATRATAEQDWHRASQLQSRGVTAQSSADQSELALRQAEAAVTQAESQIAVTREAVNGAKVGLAAKQADIAAAKAAVELAQIDLDNTTIHAPSDGRLGQVSARLGQYVTAGTALVSHIGKEVWVVANFKETELHGMRVGNPVRFTVDAMQGRSFTGRVQSFSPATASEFSLLSGTNATGNFTKIAQRLPVRISIDPGQEMHQFLTPGLSVVAHVNTKEGGQPFPEN
ncbi:HlyD family secretion protein [Paracoccus aminophilus]|uniref:Secretion protein, HlyD family protein n=1 Tax=Paracoccus aminophilus JCM 7686 TaxID=1367847 RepID=S5XQR3_PARAH|nr:HlyD family secretion protein [Paracoccus aminophilus]AGT07407.1 secretion protein, HlyD family protein [Paracoccus aminophilus JCM 7686]